MTVTFEESVRSPVGQNYASSRRHQVVDRLREEIITGRLAPGEQLKQDQLARSFALSPGPVREALRQLESEGLVEHIPNRGVFVGTVSTEDLLGVLLPVRLAIETYAVSRIRDDQETLAALGETVAAMERAADKADLNELNELDVTFHEILVKAARSSHALQLWHSVQPRIRMQIHRLASRHRDIHVIPAEHQELLDTFREGDEQKMTNVLFKHIVLSAETLLSEQAL